MLNRSVRRPIPYSGESLKKIRPESLKDRDPAGIGLPVNRFAKPNPNLKLNQ
jgi:hypothetical protein